MGLFGGVLLGLAFGDWRTVVLLGLAGMLGFGIGGAIAALLRMPTGLPPLRVGPAPLLLLLYVLVQGVVGLIGGASLGAVLGYLGNRELTERQRPRVR